MFPTEDVKKSLEHKDTSSQKAVHPLKADEAKALLSEVFKTESVVHNSYMCPGNCCTRISESEASRLLPKKFQHDWLFKPENWWLCFVEGEGMFCLICRAHDMKNPKNKQEKFAREPSVRFKVDAIETHVNSGLHSAALTTHLVQNVSLFHKQHLESQRLSTTVLEKAFSTAYFLMKHFIPNRNFVPLIDFMEKTIGQADLQHFQHRSQGSTRDIFLILGETVKELLLERVRMAEAYGLMTDEVTDISVKTQLITFIQFFDEDPGCVKTAFLSIQDVLQSHQGATAEAICQTLVDELKMSGLKTEKLMGFASDGAATMVGVRNGVASKLKTLNKLLISVHCVCHRLALACTDTLAELKYIRTVQDTLRQLWYLFENSPKNTAHFAKIQLNLKDIHLKEEASEKVVVKKLQKACQTRWLSFDKSIQAVHQQYEAILQTLNLLDKELNNATASGLLRKIHTPKFLGAVYILKEVLPILTKLSTAFQKDTLNFSMMAPMVSLTKEKLSDVGSKPLENLKRDMQSFKEMSAELNLTDHQAREIETMGEKYTAALINNLDRRFSDSSDILSAFSVFNPMAVPKATDAAFKIYGEDAISTLAKHYYGNVDTPESKQVKTDKLLSEWGHMKHMIDGDLRHKASSQSEETPTSWFLAYLLRQKASLQSFFPELLHLAEIAACLPISNAWPERGASVMKAVKTRFRSRLSNKMLEAIMQVCINGPTSSHEVVNRAVKHWLDSKRRRKLGGHHQSAAAGATGSGDVSQGEEGVLLDAGTQTETPAEAAQEVSAATTALDLEFLDTVHDNELEWETL